MADAMDRIRAAEERSNAVIERTTQLDRHITALQRSLQNLEQEVDKGGRGPQESEGRVGSGTKGAEGRAEGTGKSEVITGFLVVDRGGPDDGLSWYDLGQFLRVK